MNDLHQATSATPTFRCGPVTRSRSLLPNKPRGMPRADDRKVLNGIYWRLRTGSPWADIPERYGPATTCANRFRRWAKIGVWDRIFAAVSQAYDGDLQMVDSSSIRVHQHGGKVKEGARTPRLPPLGTELDTSKNLPVSTRI